MRTIHTFSHDAMKTTFTLRINDPNVNESAGVARECFEHLDYLETKLNRYLEGSDVWQINHMQAGDTLFLSEPCYACLKLAMEAYVDTGGLFDVTIGKQIEHVKCGLAGSPPNQSGQLAIDPERPAINCHAPGREIDLGGIGKGFALDQLKKRLQEWDVKSALLSAGASTQLCLGDQAWPVELCGDSASMVFELKEMALSASGIGIQGSHIVSPFSETTHHLHKRTWISHTSAAMADAWSTAVMLANKEELDDLNLQGCACFVETNDGRILDYFNES